MRKAFLISFLLTLLSGCASGSPHSDMPSVLIKTSLGDIIIVIDTNAAPKTSENFLTHVKNGYYDNQRFHRVIPDFMIQGGDPLGNGTGGESIWGETFEDEINAKSYNLHKKRLENMTDDPLPSNMQNMTIQEYYEVQGYQYNDSLKSLPMERGYVAMANSGPNTNGSQFFIIQREEGTEWLEGKHTIFGKIVEGMNVVDIIANLQRDGRDMPLSPVTYTMEIVE